MLGLVRDLGQQVGVPSSRIDRSALQPGDHIYSWRNGYLYAHHGNLITLTFEGIYMGGETVVHFTAADGEEVRTGTILDRFLSHASVGPRFSDARCDRCGVQSSVSGVISSCLDCFLRGGELYLFRYSVSLPFFVAQVRGGTCSLAACDPAEEVLHRADYLLRHGFGTYNVFKKNCEDFAIYCKTGRAVVEAGSLGQSGQLGTVVAAASALGALTGGGKGLISSAESYFTYLVNNDVGRRNDAIKISVEDLVSRTAEADHPAGGGELATG